MNGKTTKWNKQYQIRLAILYIFLNGCALLTTLGWGWVLWLTYGIIIAIIVGLNFGRSFANVGLFKKNPVKIFLLPLPSLFLPIVIFTIKAVLKGGFIETCFNTCSRISLGEIITHSLVLNPIFLIVANIPMFIAYFISIKKIKEKDLANQRQIELKTQQAAAEKEAAEAKALEDILKNRPE